MISAKDAALEVQNWYNTLGDRQLETIGNRVRMAASIGQRTVTYKTDKIHHTVCDELRRLGYELQPFFTDGRAEIKISW